MWLKTIKNYYKNGIYKNEDLVIFVNAKMITDEQMKEIIGDN